MIRRFVNRLFPPRGRLGTIDGFVEMLNGFLFSICKLELIDFQLSTQDGLMFLDSYHNSR